MIFEFLILVSAVAVFTILLRIFRQTFAIRQHLTQDQIENYVRNRMSEEDQYIIRRHLGDCEACRSLLDSYNRGNPSD